jgi:hypothetical protein
MKIKATMRYHLTPVSMAIKINIINTLKDVKNGGLSSTLLLGM